jgi:hypothetical protein
MKAARSDDDWFIHLARLEDNGSPEGLQQLCDFTGRAHPGPVPGIF